MVAQFPRVGIECTIRVRVGRVFCPLQQAPVLLPRYSLMYLTTRLQIVNVVSIVVYVGYMAMISAAFFLLTGCKPQLLSSLRVVVSRAGFTQ